MQCYQHTRVARFANAARRRIASTAGLTSSTIFVSKSTSPYFNLSIEDWLLKNAPAEKPALFLYRNAPSVIIGRNQNPWKETNITTLRAKGIDLVRRRSGGGAVYHDLGNTNFSIHTPRASFARARTAGVIARALRDRLGVRDAALNARNDVCVGSQKVSGSAYKMTGTRAYHHGTMLITSRLDTLGDALRNDKVGMVTKGVESVRSPVGVLRDWIPDASHDAFVDAVVASFSEEYGSDEKPVYINQSDFDDVELVRKSVEELQTWEWVYGQTPEFTHTLAHNFAWGTVTIEIHSKNGIILDVSSEGAPATLSHHLVGQRYGTLNQLPNTSLNMQSREIIRWLLESM